MSPAKKSLKTVALPIAKLGFTNVHRISQGSYRGWLGALLQSKPNQKLFLKHEKDVVDQCFREQAMQEYALENNRLKQALAGINQEASKAFWSRWRASLGLSHPKAVEEASFEIAAGLTLPKIGQKMRQTSSSDRLECETYEIFAQHAERKNPDTVFTKELMDAAFRKAVSRVGPTTLSWKGGTSGVITQCLGKESTKY